MINLSRILEILSGKGSVEKAIKELKKELLSADIEEEIVNELINKIKNRLSKEKTPGISERELSKKIFFEELKNIFGEEKEFNIIKHRKILLIGLYGSGKTTTCAKLCWYIKSKGFDPVFIEADTFRKGSYDQAKQLAEQIKVKFYGDENEKNSLKIIEEGLKIKGTHYIVDTSGRDALNDDYIKEIENIQEFFKPDLTLLVIPSDVSSRVVKQFEKFKIDGVIITKMDGVGKGGAVLTILKRMKIPVYFIGTGEKIHQFQPFSTKEYVAKLFGIPDFESWYKKFEIVKPVVEEINTEEFTLEEFIKSIEKSEVSLDLFGQDILNMFKNFGVKLNLDKEDLEMMYHKNKKKFIAIYNSMTIQERKNPEIVLKEKSRITRIAKGSGTSEEDVKLFINQYLMTKKLLKSQPRNIYDLLRKFGGFRFRFP